MSEAAPLTREGRNRSTERSGVNRRVVVLQATRHHGDIPAQQPSASLRAVRSVDRQPSQRTRREAHMVVARMFRKRAVLSLLLLLLVAPRATAAPRVIVISRGAAVA